MGKAKEEKNQRIFGSSNGGIMSLFIEMETTGNDFRTTICVRYVG